MPQIEPKEKTTISGRQFWTVFFMVICAGSQIAVAIWAYSQPHGVYWATGLVLSGAVMWVSWFERVYQSEE